MFSAEGIATTAAAKMLTKMMRNFILTKVLKKLQSLNVISVKIIKRLIVGPRLRITAECHIIFNN